MQQRLRWPWMLCWLIHVRDLRAALAEEVGSALALSLSRCAGLPPTMGSAAFASDDDDDVCFRI